MPSTQQERQKKYWQKHCHIWGYRAIHNWTYTDPLTKKKISLTPNDFLTQPFSNGPHRCARYPQKDLLIPRCLLRTTRATCLKADQDYVLIGAAFPKFWQDKRHPHISGQKKKES